MFSLKTIDLAIGVVLLYLLLTFVASALLELFSMAANWRGQMLHDAIGNMLKNSTLATVEEIYSHPQILALCRGGAARSRLDLVERVGWKVDNGGTPPSYIPAATFSGAMLETVLNRAETEVELSPDGVVLALQILLKQKVHTSHTKCACCARSCEKDALQSVLRTTMATQGNSVQAVRFAIEKWFNDSMDRVSGWYKRRTQCCLLAIGIAIAYGANVSTIAVSRWLWQSDAARQAVVAAANEMVAKGQPQQAQGSGNQAPPPGNALASGGSPAPATPEDLAKRIADVDRRVVELQYPVGWSASYLQPAAGQQPNRGWLPEYLVGGLLTAIAISMGSTFWFDALQNLLKIRGSGPKPSGR